MVEMIQAERPTSQRHASLRHLERTSTGDVALFLGGTFAAASDGGARELVDPATDDAYVKVAEATAADAARAIAIARQAFDEGPWPETFALDRARLLNKIADALDANAADFAAMETLNCGKPLREAEYDVPTRRTASATTRGSRRSRTGKPSRFRRRRRVLPCASRSGSAGKSCRGTTRC